MKSPDNLKIIPRDITINLSDALKEKPYWLDNDPVKTHFFNALQSAFPEGERLFIDSARDVRDKYNDRLSETLKQQIKLFIKQEAFHGAHHEEWNRALSEGGYKKVATYSEWFRKRRLILKKRMPPLYRLAMTAAGEHFTAITARLNIHGDPEFMDSVDRPFRDLILYHAIEEIEHKAVCFDLYQQAGGGYLTRIMGAISFTFGMIFHVRRIHVYLLKKDGLWNRETKKKARQEVWGKEGLVRKLLPDIFDYLRPNFHPWEIDDRTWLLKDFNEDLKEYGIDPPEYL